MTSRSEYPVAKRYANRLLDRITARVKMAAPQAKSATRGHSLRAAYMPRRTTTKYRSGIR